MRLFTLITICLVLTAWNTLAYPFTLNPAKTKTESVSNYDKAHDLYLKGRYSDAQKGYEEFIKNYPDSQLVITALYYSAKCCAEQKDYNNARACYNDLINKYKEGFWADCARDEIARIESAKIQTQ